MQFYWLGRADGRLRRRALRAFLRHGGGGAVRARARGDGGAGAAHLADACSPAAREEAHERKDGESFMRAPHAADREPGAAAVPAARACRWARWRCSPAATSPTRSACRRCCAAMSRWNDGVQDWLFDPKRLAPEFPESRDHPAVPVQRLLRRGRSARGRRRQLQARGRRAWCARRSPGRCPSSTRCRRCRRSRATSASKAGAPSASGAACASPTSCSASAPTLTREVRRLQVRRRLLHQHRHGDGAASADPAHASASATQLLPPKYGFPMKLRMPTKLGFKNPKHIARDLRHQRRIPAATGKTRATTGIPAREMT